MEENNETVAVAVFDDNSTKAALRKYELPDEKIKIMAEKANALVIKDVNDNEGYKTVIKALSIVKKKRTTIEATRKKLKEPALKFGRSIDAEARRITELLKPIESQLSDRKNKHEQERSKAATAEYERRRNLIVQAGYMFDGRYYTLGTVMIHPDTLEKATPEIFQEYIDRAEVERKRLEEAKGLAQKKEVDTAQEQSIAASVNEENDPVKVIMPKEPVTEPAQTPAPKTPGPVADFSNKVQEEAAPQPQPEQPQTVSEYAEGFNEARRLIVEVLHNPNLRTRSDIFEKIKELKPAR